MVTVLIGAYRLSTGQPCVGVVNQPFVTPASGEEYRGQAHWGLCVGGHRATSVTSSQVSRPEEEKPRVLIGSAEEERIIAALSEHFTVVRAGGAGHKLLMVALGWCINTIDTSYIINLYPGLADVYINSGASTYKWDTCAPHCMLVSLGGGVRGCRQHIGQGGDRQGGGELVYNVHMEGADRCNSGGVIAFRDNSCLDLVVNLLQKL